MTESFLLETNPLPPHRLCTLWPLSVYNNIMKTCDLSISSNYHLFKQGIKPMWEDPANKHGGKWSIQLPRNKTMSDIDNIWLYTVSLFGFVALSSLFFLFSYFLFRLRGDIWNSYDLLVLHFLIRCWPALVRPLSTRTRSAESSFRSARPFSGYLCGPAPLTTRRSPSALGKRRGIWGVFFSATLGGANGLT